MSEEKITPDEVRAHLRLDDFSGEGELLKMYTDAALEACQKHIGKRFEDGLEFTPAIRVGCLMYIAFLYENREAVSPVEQSELPMAISALWSVYRTSRAYYSPAQCIALMVATASVHPHITITIEGTNPSLAIVDEYHLHPDNGVYSALELGMGARPEGLLFAITTSGSNVVSACKQHYDYCCQILDGEEVNESMFVLIYELDDESEVDDPAMWIKANPNIDVSVDREKLASTIQKARGIPSQWVEMLTKRFNIWCQGATPWMGNGAWAECAGTFAEADLYGQECYAGLDLSSTSDISSVCYAFPVGKKIMLVSRHYLPEFQLQNPANKNRAIYRQWVKAGWIRTTPGDCIDYDRIRDDIMADAENFNIRLVGFDTWNATHLRTQLQGAGFEVEPFPQTYLRFSPAAKSFEVFVNRKVIVHRGDPVLAWSMSNVVMQSDANANIKPNKKKSSNKIDPSVAALMAFGTFQAEHEEFAFDMSDSHKERLAAFDGV